MKTEIKVDEKLVAYCGLYCGACGKYLNGKCPACLENEKATWCRIRTCNQENKIRTCARCKEYEDLHDCRHFNNVMAKLFEFLFRSDRYACIARIKEEGIENFAQYMTEKRQVTIKK